MLEIKKVPIPINCDITDNTRNTQSDVFNNDVMAMSKYIHDDKNSKIKNQSYKDLSTVDPEINHP